MLIVAYNNVLVDTEMHDAWRPVRCAVDREQKENETCEDQKTERSEGTALTCQVT